MRSASTTTGLAVAAGRTLDADETRALAALAARRLAREPVARILGVKEFWGLPLRITAATLVPRPETETVVEAALAAIDAGGPRTRALRIADLGTGRRAAARAAVRTAERLRHRHRCQPRSAGGRARQCRPARPWSRARDSSACDFGAALAGGFDLVVSNPPYVASGDIAALAPEVRHDPRRALDGGADGLACYRAIAGQAPRLLTPAGHLVVELGIGQEAAVAALFRSAGLDALARARRSCRHPACVAARVATMTP